MKSRILALLVTLVVVTSMVVAQQAKSKPKVTMEQARATAVAKVHGDVESEELEREHGKLVYSFDIKTADSIREIQVDANTGTIVSDQVESAADEAKEAARAHKKGTSKKTSHAPVPAHAPE